MYNEIRFFTPLRCDQNDREEGAAIRMTEQTYLSSLKRCVYQMSTRPNMNLKSVCCG